ncbi:sulfotransferase domain-containing protein [Thermodesulfobacteriota bacterium]
MEGYVIKPNFLIVGAAKCGTTSLYHWLKSHPEIYMPERRHKEPTFFVGDEEYKGEFKSFDSYLKIFHKAGAAKAIGEASTLYLYSKIAPQKIKKFLGNNVKIIIMLRDPVKMIYSLWLNNKRELTETLSFEEALEAEEKRFYSQEFRQNKSLRCPSNFFYTRRTRFLPQIKRYLDEFDRKNILFIKLKDMSKDPEKTYRDTLEFLDVDYFQMDSFPVKNISGGFRSSFLTHLMRNYYFRLPFKIIPENFRQRIAWKIYLWNHMSYKNKPQTMDQIIENSLRNRFARDINLLEEITDLDLSDWKGL